MGRFFVIVLSAWTLMHAYVFWRAASVPVVRRRVGNKAMSLFAVVAWSSYIVTNMIESLVPPWMGWLAETLSADWLGIMFLMFVCMLMADLLTGFGFFLPRLAPSVRGYALLAGGVLSAIALVQGVRAPLVRNYEVRIAGARTELEGTVVVAVSDLHVGTLLGKKWLGARVDQINGQKPDLIVLAGDIGEGHGGNVQELVTEMRRLSAPLGVWGVNGNHEGFGRSGERAKFLENAGVQILRDRWVELRPGLVLAGVEDLTSRRRRTGRTADSVDRALASRPPGATTIFVSHTPWEAERAARQGSALMVSGHTHNGQIWPFTYVVAMTYPMVGGRYEVAGMPVIVCRGTGTWGPRMRLWSRGEILRIVLRAG